MSRGPSGMRTPPAASKDPGLEERWLADGMQVGGGGHELRGPAAGPSHGRALLSSGDTETTAVRCSVFDDSTAIGRTSMDLNGKPRTTAKHAKLSVSRASWIVYWGSGLVILVKPI